jgi:hypothetical protein
MPILKRKIDEYGNYCKDFISNLNPVHAGRKPLYLSPADIRDSIFSPMFACHEECAIHRCRALPEFLLREEGIVENIFLLAGIAGSVGGVCLLVYQGLMYLMHNNWTQYTVLSAVEQGPDFLRNAVLSSPQATDTLGSCPLFAALIALGLVLLFIGSRLRNRYG